MALSLPQELLLAATDAMAIAECDSFRQAFRDRRVQDCYYERISIPKFLSAYMFDGSRLIKAMAESDTALIGPMALEYFLRGSAMEHAAWVFFCASGRRGKEHFVKFMESEGVFWDTALTTLTSLCAEREIRGPLNANFEMKRTHFCRAASISDDLDLRLIGQEFNWSDAPTVRATYWDGWVYELSDEPIRGWEALRGYILSAGRKQPVELIYDSLERGLDDYLAELPSTALQCAITGFGAVHMYGKLTEQGLQHTWKPGFVGPGTREGRWINDITLKAFNVVDSDTQYKQDPAIPGPCGLYRNSRYPHGRDTFDSEAVFVKIENSLGWPEQYYSTALMTLCLWRWQHYCNTIQLRKKATSHPLCGPTRDELKLFLSSLVPAIADGEYLEDFGL